MSEQPWMPLYVADYLGDTQHLSTEEHGVYMLILMSMWRHGRLRNDPKILSRLTRVSPRRWHLFAYSVLSLLKEDEDGFLYSPRLEREHRKAISFREKQSANSRRGVEAKALKNNNQHPASGSPTVQPNATLPQSQSQEERKEEGASAPVVGFQGVVIKLRSADYLSWKQIYSNLELDAELSAHDAFLADQPPEDQKRWFIRTATHLRNRNAAMKAKPKSNGAASLAVDWGIGAERQLKAREKPLSEEEMKKRAAQVEKYLKAKRA